MIQIASKSSLAKKKIDVKRGIIDASYTENIIIILQNNSDKLYKIKSHEKIAQAIFLSLVKILQLAPNIAVNFMEEDSDQIELIYIDTIIFIPFYQQYILKVNRKIQNQALVFEANFEICLLANIANLYLPAKAHKHFKISIHNLTKNIIKTLEGTLNLPKESYLFMPEEINKLNLENLNTLQQMQLKILLNQYANVFASKNEFGCTNIVKHQIDTENAQPIKQ
ncbi:hypothetical protein G9A89_008502 [Geosiphon pyriformis]|nr:hypothetical protein G9A89_008502 [Geosiphon pyriformis]